MSDSPDPTHVTPPINPEVPENELYLPTELYKQVNRFLERFFDPSPIPLESKVDLTRLMSAIPFQTILDILYVYFCPEGEGHPDPPNSSLRAGGTQLGAVVSTLVPYVSVAYDVDQLEHVVGRVLKECSEWIREMVNLPEFTGTLFHLDTVEVKERLPPLLAALDKELILPMSRLIMNRMLGKQTFAEYAAFMKQNTELSGDNCKFLVKAIQEVFYESTKANLSEKDFLDSLQLISITEPGRDLYTIYEENHLQIRDSLTQGISMTSYYDLRWRVEVQTARKVLLQEAVPKITLVLTLGKKGRVKNLDNKGVARLGDVTDLKDHILQMDPKTLVRITRTLEAALSEAMSPYCKRIKKHIKRCIGGVSRIAQLALHQKYPGLYEEGPSVLNTGPPVIYISPAAPENLELQLALHLNLGRNSIVRLPPLTNGCPVIDVSKFEEIITKHTGEGKRPLLVLAYMGTPDTGHMDDFTRLSCVCSLENIWLHIAGISLSNLVLPHRQNFSSLTNTVTHGNSLTLDIGLWFGLPTLPNVTLYKESDAVISNRDITHKLIGLKTKQEYLLPIVVWTTILSIGRKGLISTVDYAMGISTAIVQGISEIPSIQLISPEQASFMIRFGYRGPPFFLKKAKDTSQATPDDPTQYLPVEMINDFFCVISDSLLPDFPTLNLQEGPETNELRYLTIDVYYCFTQLGAGLEEVNKFVKKLKSVTDELNATLYTRVQVNKQLIKDSNLFVRDVKGRTSTACIHYMPTKLLNTPVLRSEQITELNKANRKLAVHMNERHHAYGYCYIQDYVYVELGRIQPGEEQAVFETFSELKEQANQLDVESDQLDVLSEQVAAVLSNAQAELVEEQDKAFWDEGIIRKVPLIGSVVNWWSPYNPQPTGRSFNFISGKMESTGEVYKNKAQLTTDESGTSLADSSLISASNLSLASKTGSTDSPLKEKPVP